MPQYHVRMPDGRMHGPADLAAIGQWVRQGSVQRHHWLVDAETGASRPVTDFPELAALFPRDLGEILIPKNTHAVISYYVGLFSIAGICLLGLPATIMGGIAVWLGVKGLKNAKANPAMRGKAHAWAGIIMGTLFGLIGLAVAVGFLMPWIAAR